MKQSFRFQAFFLAVVLPALCGAAQAAPFDENSAPVLDNVTQQTITPLKKSVSVDDYLIRMGRAADIEVIADVTDIPEEERAKPYPASPAAIANKWKPTLVNVTYDLTSQAKLSQLRYDERTFLFWRQPELVPLARDIITEGKAAVSVPPPGLKNSISALSVAVFNYVRKTNKWTSRQPLSLELLLLDLPADLQEKIRLFKQDQDLKADLRLPLWFSDEFWNKARVGVEQITADNDLNDARPKPPVVVLRLQGFDARNRPVRSDVYSLRLEVARSALTRP